MPISNATLNLNNVFVSANKTLNLNNAYQQQNTEFK
jgi:hypothetical protein